MAKKPSRRRRGAPRATARGRLKRRPSPRRTVPPAAVEAVLAELAHDIRTPLTGIVALSELLAASELGERERQWVRALKSGAEHLTALTTLVVDAAKSNAGKLVLNCQPFDPQALASAAATSLVARAEGAGLKSVIDIASMPPVVVGDAVRLRAALENLIDNAVKFTEQGEVRLRASVIRRARDLKLVFAVTDSGLGMSAAEIKRLFRPFTQAHVGIGQRFGGAGLGLSLVKRLARAMGGNLTVTSAPGKGSTFELSVAVRPAPWRETGEVAPRVTRKLDVLYVEDNPYGRVVMNTILTGLGHQADFVASADSALEAIERRHYDLVLMDVTLGADDGIEATRRIRALPPPRGRVPIIGISGHDDAAKRQAGRAAGMDLYLIKPVTPRVLADAIASVVT